MMLAARYPAQPLAAHRWDGHVIGPAIFPFYWFVLKMALLGMLVIHVIASAVLVATGKHASDVIASLVTLPVGPGVMVFGWVTLVFAVADRQITRLPFITDWNPESLPPLRKEPSGPSRLRSARSQRSWRVSEGPDRDHKGRRDWNECATVVGRILMRAQTRNDPASEIRASRRSVDLECSLLPIQSNFVERAAWPSEAHIEVGLIREVASQEAHTEVPPALTVPGSNVIPVTVGWAAVTPPIMVPRKYGSQKSCAFPGARLSWFVGEPKTIKLLDRYVNVGQ
jgi:hypothetical protein